jgi:hypothetical protein
LYDLLLPFPLAVLVVFNPESPLESALVLSPLIASIFLPFSASLLVFVLALARSIIYAPVVKHVFLAYVFFCVHVGSTADVLRE